MNGNFIIRPPVLVTVDPVSKRVRRGMKEVLLTPQEFHVLARLADCSGVILTKAALIEGFKFESSEDSIKLCIGRTRKKLGDDARNPVYIFNRSGFGYWVSDLVVIGTVRNSSNIII